MARIDCLLACLAALVLACQTTKPDYSRPLRLGAPPLLPLDPGERPPSMEDTWHQRAELLAALDRSIAWTRSEPARRAYPAAGITHARALASLERLRELLDQCRGGAEFQRAVQSEFVFLKSAGWDGRGGGVLFTGYCTPILKGSRTRSNTYRYPLYSQPPDLLKAPDGTSLGQRTPAGPRPYPTRKEIERDRLLAGQNLELVWLRDPIDAFIAHVNGSAVVELEEGGPKMRLGYSAKNGREYVSLGKELQAAGILDPENTNLTTIRRWARNAPQEVERFTWRNDSYVFFTEIDGYPRGSLNVEVQDERTLATDKTLFPPGAMVFVDTVLPTQSGGRRTFRKLMLDQDTGGAIRTAGRADIYLGTGPEAEARAGSTAAKGQMYYLFLRDEPRL